MDHHHFECSLWLLVCVIAGSVAVLLMQCFLLVVASFLSFVQGAGEYSPTLHKGHRGIFNVNRLVPTDGTPV